MATTQYKPEYVERTKEMCANGATNAELAKEFGVSTWTIRHWASQFPEFQAAMVANKPIADARVVRSLYERANGYSYEAVKIFCGKDGTVTKVPYTEHVPPDVTAAIFWLKNRQSQDWRDKQDLELSGGVSLADAIAEARKRASKSK
jgi:hypothetical protein